jgi:hypothetical protein
MNRFLLALALSKLAASQPVDQHADLGGIWNNATSAPLERPERFKDKLFFTTKEAEEWAGARTGRSEEPPPRPGTNSVGTYNVAWREFGSLKTLRTSIITDPPDGRLPALTPSAAAERQRRVDLLRHPKEAKDMGLQDRCLVFTTAVPPMMPYSYNSNYQFVQTANELMIHIEMAHDTRIIHLDRREHAPPGVRFWLGDSIGHWEGKTLLVDTANFNDGGGFFGDAGGMFGWDRNLHVVERFTLADANTIVYRFQVEDPTAYSRPWKGELTMSRAPGPIYEYACHEGNYAMPTLLKTLR